MPKVIKKTQAKNPYKRQSTAKFSQTASNVFEGVLERLKIGDEKYDDLQAEVKKLQNQMTQKDSQIEALQNGMTQKDSQIEALQNGMTQKDSQIEALQNGMTQKDRQIDKLQSQLEQLQKEFANFRNHRPLAENVIEETDLPGEENSITIDANETGSLNQSYSPSVPSFGSCSCGRLIKKLSVCLECVKNLSIRALSEITEQDDTQMVPV
ncbi:hypothetical protein HA402_002107 [Bradysia odoriphaga]|nr:hypothetical protein HA402_002107 [Bradysia odoriphaga]